MSTIKTRQHLLNIARELFARKGYESTTMNDIAMASQRGRRTLYTYFRNKEEIYFAVIADEMTYLETEIDRVANMVATPEERLCQLIFVHLRTIKEAVERNGTLRAEFFRNSWMVEKVRKPFDAKVRHIIFNILREGVEAAHFIIDDVALMTEIIQYSIRGIELPFIFDRIHHGHKDEETMPLVLNILRRTLGVKPSQLSTNL